MMNVEPFISDNHLDLGCGDKPKNPYGAYHVYGLDIRKHDNTKCVTFITADLSLEKIPFDADFFSSVSAFDFIEHIPRVLCDPDKRRTIFPFIELMNEIHRILIPGGRFYAVTPLYPAEEAFKDPTHVNIITASTHSYFCGEDPMGAIYGFKGRFKLLSVAKGVPRNFFNPRRPSWFARLSSLRRWMTNDITHIKWELEKC